jgi:hypothetical protein
MYKPIATLMRPDDAAEVRSRAGRLLAVGVTLRSGALLALSALATPVHGVDETISGGSLALRQGRQKAQLVLVAHAPIVAPLPGTSEDPTLRGAVLDIGNPATGEWARLVAPASGWSVNALGTVFRFRGPARGPSGIRSLVIRHGRRLRLKASAVGITLDEPAQGGLAVSLASGTRRYCMVFGGTVRRDEPGKFAARNAPAPSACPVPGTTIPTTTTTATSSTLAAAPPRSTSTTRRATSTTSSSSTSSTKPPKPPKDPMGGRGGDDDGDDDDSGSGGDD